MMIVESLLKDVLFWLPYVVISVFPILIICAFVSDYRSKRSRKKALVNHYYKHRPNRP